MSPKLIVMPPLSNGRIKQPAPFGGICHAVGVPPAGPVSVSLQVVEPWSNAQLCPPPVDGCAGSLCSKTELSGTNIEPAVPVKKAPGDQLTAGGWPRTKPPGGNVVPSAHTAQAKFWQRKVNAVADASFRRARLAKFASPRFRIMVYSVRCCTAPMDDAAQMYPDGETSPSGKSPPKPAEPEPNRRFADNKNPRRCGRISDDPPIYIRPFCSRQRGRSP